MTELAVAWLVFVAWAIPTFTWLERALPREQHRVPSRRIAAASLLLFVEAAFARTLAWTEPGPLARVAAAWFVTELAMYWLHRAQHRVGWLWRFHRLHHRDEPLAWATAWYSHPVDTALFAACGLVAGVVCGAGLPTSVAVVTIRRVWTIVLHANVRWPASAVDAVVSTPAFHLRHHREDLPPANFASTLPILDRMFGTQNS